MNKGNVLLARPNSFIVKHMKRLVEESGHVPLPISAIKEMERVDASALKAIVISTSVSSVVEENYFDVYQIVKEKFPEVPVFLASLTEVDSVKRAFKQNDQTNDVLIQSIHEAAKSSEKKAVVVIRKSDLTDGQLFQETLRMFNQKAG